MKSTRHGQKTTFPMNSDCSDDDDNHMSEHHGNYGDVTVSVFDSNDVVGGGSGVGCSGVFLRVCFLLGGLF